MVEGLDLGGLDFDNLLGWLEYHIRFFFFGCSKSWILVFKQAQQSVSIIYPITNSLVVGTWLGILYDFESAVHRTFCKEKKILK